MGRRRNISSGATWADIGVYSRAVRIGNVIEVVGTTAAENDQLIGPGDAAEQTRFILRKIEWALREAGAGMKDVIRSRVYVTDI